MIDLRTRVAIHDRRGITQSMIGFAYLIEPPFNDRQADGWVTGCDVDLAKTVLAASGIDDVDLIETEFAQLLPGLLNGRWRMTTGLFATDERRAVAAFSRPIWARSLVFETHANAAQAVLDAYGSFAFHNQTMR